jgi:DNA-binding CsgD family transcriptional regulator
MWASSAPLAVTPEARQELERIVRSGKTEQRISLRARIILGAADGKSNNLLATELKTSRPTVLDWRRRFAEGGVKALDDNRPRGRSFQAVGARQGGRDYYQDTKRSTASHAVELQQHGQGLRRQQGVGAARLACQRLEAAFGQDV